MTDSKSGIFVPPSLRWRLEGKYVLDRILAVFLLMILWPLFLLVAILIKLDGWLAPKNAGPVFYTEPRVSEGRIFRIIKFRTVPVGKVRWVGEKPESRSISYVMDRTRAGEFVLKWYLDELPQLLNIAKGEMSFIGPRPDVAAFYEQENLPHLPYWKVLKGGLMGITQACKQNPRRRKDFERMAAQMIPKKLKVGYLDAYYFERVKRSSFLGILKFDWYLLGLSLQTSLKGEDEKEY